MLAVWIAAASGVGSRELADGGRYRIGGAAHGTLAVGALVSVEAGTTTEVTVRMVPSVRSDGVVMRHDDPSRDEVAVGHAVTQADGSSVLEGVPGPGDIAGVELGSVIAAAPP